MMVIKFLAAPGFCDSFAWLQGGAAHVWLVSFLAAYEANDEGTLSMKENALVVSDKAPWPDPPEVGTTLLVVRAVQLVPGRARLCWMRAAGSHILWMVEFVAAFGRDEPGFNRWAKLSLWEDGRRHAGWRAEQTERGSADEQDPDTPASGSQDKEDESSDVENPWKACGFYAKQDALPDNGGMEEDVAGPGHVASTTPNADGTRESQEAMRQLVMKLMAENEADRAAARERRAAQGGSASSSSAMPTRREQPSVWREGWQGSGSGWSSSWGSRTWSGR